MSECLAGHSAKQEHGNGGVDILNMLTASQQPFQSNLPDCRLARMLHTFKPAAHLPVKQRDWQVARGRGEVRGMQQVMIAEPLPEQAQRRADSMPAHVLLLRAVGTRCAEGEQDGRG